MHTTHTPFRPTKLDDFRGDCKPSGDQINFKYCPVCGHDGWKAYVNPLTGGWFCFAGIHNQGGKVEVGLPGDTAGQYLLDLLHAQPLGIPEWSETDLPPWEPLSKSALRYLASRQIDEAAARRYGLVEWTDHYRIVFPYFSNAGDMIFWTSRRYSKAVGYGPKYLAGPGPKPLYMRHVNSGHLVLVEGVFDALSVERAGFAAAALGGKSLPRYLVTFLLTNAERYGIINVMLDADALAKSLGIRSQLMSKRVVKICAYPPGQDPAQMGPDRIQELII